MLNETAQNLQARLRGAKRRASGLKKALWQFTTLQHNVGLKQEVRKILGGAHATLDCYWGEYVNQGYAEATQEDNLIKYIYKKRYIIRYMYFILILACAAFFLFTILFPNLLFYAIIPFSLLGACFGIMYLIDYFRTRWAMKKKCDKRMGPWYIGEVGNKTVFIFPYEKMDEKMCMYVNVNNSLIDQGTRFFVFSVGLLIINIFFWCFFPNSILDSLAGLIIISIIAYFSFYIVQKHKVMPSSYPKQIKFSTYCNRLGIYRVNVELCWREFKK